MRRGRKKHPGLYKDGDLKIRHELYEGLDYIHKLNEKEKKWLSDFNLEFINTDFNHPGKRIHPKTVRTRKVKSTGKSKKVDLEKKDAYDRNNARNADVFAIAKSNFMLSYDQKDTFDGANHSLRRSNIPDVTREDMLIAIIDENNKIRRKKESQE